MNTSSLASEVTLYSVILPFMGTTYYIILKFHTILG